MAKPLLLAVDDNPDDLRELVKDLERGFADRVRVVAEAGEEGAIRRLEAAERRREPVALLVWSNAGANGGDAEPLLRAAARVPQAKKVLLTTYARRDDATRSVEAPEVDQYLVKPYQPPEDRLFPVLADLLDDWFARHTPTEGARILGHRWSASAYALRDFLARNQVPFRWIDVERHADDPEVKRVIEERGPPRLPVVLLEDGTRLERPETAELAERIGLQTRAERPFYDLVIVGGGPAGLAAAVYGGSEGLCTVVIEREAPGGQAGSSSLIENYLGFPSGLSGADLARRAVDQAKRFGCELLTPQEAVELQAHGQYRIVCLASGQEVASHAVLLAMGVAYRRLEVPGEERLVDKGLYYGASMSEAISCADEHVATLGGGNSAGQAALHFAKYARKVTMLVREDSLEEMMSAYLVERIHDAENVDVMTGVQVRELGGDEHLERILVSFGDGDRTLEVDALFAFIGAEPHTEWLEGVLARDREGFILTGENVLRDPVGRSLWPLRRHPMLLETSTPGVFAAGDVVAGSTKRVAASVGQGSTAIQLVHEYLRDVGA